MPSTSEPCQEGENATTISICTNENREGNFSPALDKSFVDASSNYSPNPQISSYTLPKKTIEKLTSILQPKKENACTDLLKYYISNAKADGYIKADYTPKDILDSLLSASYRKDESSVNLDSIHERIVLRQANTLTLNHGFFYEKIPDGSSIGSTQMSGAGNQARETEISAGRQASILVGEGVHLLFQEKSDVILANYTAKFRKDEKKVFTDEVKASDYFHSFLESKCH